MDEAHAKVPWPRVWGFGVLLWFTYGYFIPSPSWNPNSRFDLTLALVEHHHVNIDPYHSNTGDKARRNGHYYSDKAPGVAILAVPAYAVFREVVAVAGGQPPAVVTVGRNGEMGVELAKGDGEDDVLLSPTYRWGQYVAALFTCGLAGAGLGVMMIVAAIRRGHCVQDATAIGMALSLGTLIFPYSTTLYGHTPAAALAFGALLILWLADASTRAKMFVSGLLASLAAACEWPAALLTCLVGLYAVTRCRTPKIAAFWPLGALPPAILVLVYNYAAFGSVFHLGYGHLDRSEFAVGMSSGLMGIGWPTPRVLLSVLFGRARGLFYTSPILLVATWGLVTRKGARDPLAYVAAASVVAFLLISSGYYMWWGGSAFGPRHVIPALPLWCLGLVCLRRSSKLQPWTGHLVFACLALSMINMALGTAVGLEAPMATDILFHYTYPLAAQGRFPYAAGASNLGRIAGLSGWFSIMPVIVLWVIYIAWVWRLPTPLSWRKEENKASSHE